MKEIAESFSILLEITNNSTRYNLSKDQINAFLHAQKAMCTVEIMQLALQNELKIKE